MPKKTHGDELIRLVKIQTKEAVLYGMFITHIKLLKIKL